MTRLYGTGSLWLKKTTRHPDGQWWIRYCTAARRVTEKSDFCECHDKQAESKAEKFLLKRIGQAEAGTLPSPRAQRTLTSDLADMLFKVYRAELLQKIPENLPEQTRAWRKTQAERILKEQRARWDKHLAPVFGDSKAALVTAEDLSEYQAARITVGARYATINREMQLLRRAFRLGFEARPKLVSDVPKFPRKLPESPRQGFIEDEVFHKLHAAITEPGLAALILTAYRLGFRKSELQNLLCLQLADGWLRLFAGATKNGKARSVKLPDDIHEVLTACASGKAPDAYLLTWRDGSQLRDFRASWEKATKAAGRPDLMFHDLRRSAVRRMKRKLGIPTATAQLVTGHLTAAIFNDYDKSNPEDVAEAAKIL